MTSTLLKNPINWWYANKKKIKQLNKYFFIVLFIVLIVEKCSK